MSPRRLRCLLQQRLDIDVVGVPAGPQAAEFHDPCGPDQTNLKLIICLASLGPFRFSHGW
jgi:hypothetical protein